MKLFQWHFGLYLIPLAFLLPMSNANASNLNNVTCSAGMNTIPGSTGIVNLGTIAGTNTSPTKISVRLNYSCTHNGDTDGFVTLCFGVDGGFYDPGTISPRYLSLGGLYKEYNPARLTFTMKPDGLSLWGTRSSGLGNELKTLTLPIARKPVGGSPTVITGFFNVDIELSGPGNTPTTDGIYSNDFGDGSHTALSYNANSISSSANCSTGKQQSNRFPFKVTANINKECKITANPGTLDLGSASASEKNITGNGNIGVKCTKSTPYNIGLAPMTPNPSGNTNGGGWLNGTGGNTNQVPYQLFSDAARTKKWGNNGSTFATLTNGVTGTSDDGLEKSHIVYVTVPSADFKPDTYTDTVTIKVNY